MDTDEKADEGIAMEQEDVKAESLSSDQESSDDDNEDQINQQEIDKLQELVKSSPYHYDSHIQLISLLRKNGDLDQLRRAREKMNEIFPLSPELWLDWLKDESKLADCSESRQMVRLLFERAVKDYTSVDVWLEYCQFMIGELVQTNGAEAVRLVFEKAVTAVGLHVASGHLIWETYREFENAVLGMMQPTPGSVADEATVKKIDEQVKRISSIFKRQLSVPSLNLTQTFEEFIEWNEEEANDSHFKHKYQAVQKKMKDRHEYELKLESSEKPHYAEYLEYIKFEEKEGDAARVQSIYERAILDNCLIAELWLQYCNYVDKKLKIKDIALPLHERSVRNCPWAISLWTSYLQVFERFQQPSDAIQTMFDRALNSGFTQADDYRLLWMTHLEYLNRQVDLSQIDEDNEAVKVLHETFQKAVDFLDQYFGQDGDPSCSIRKFWAMIEARCLKNIVRARQIWTDIMSKGNGKYAQMWLEYYHLERSFGDVKHERKILQQGVQKASDNPELLVEEFLNFEKVVGTLEQYDSACAKCESHMNLVQERRAKAVEKEAELKQKVVERRKFEKSLKKKKKTDEKVEENKCSTADNEQQRVAEGARRKQEKNEGTFSKQAVGKRSVPPGYAERSVAPKKAKVSDGDGHSAEDTNTAVERKANDDRSVFLSNLPFTAEEQAIKDVFKSVGVVTDLRIVKDHKGKSRGFAYLELENQKQVEDALKLDRHLVDGRPMFVSPCESDKSNHKIFKYDTTLEKNKLFVRGLAFKTTKRDLEEYFSQFGKLSDVRLVTHKSGKSKGLAYVDFIDETSASKAVIQADGATLLDHQILVALSNPPTRKTNDADSTKSTFGAPSQWLGNSSRPPFGTTANKFGGRGRGRSNVMMVPRSLAAAKASENGATHDEANKTANMKMSNSDFRNMLLKK